MDQFLSTLRDYAEEAWGVTVDLYQWLVVDRALPWLGQAWEWWVNLFPQYAWQEIGAYLVPFVAVLMVVLFYRILRLHMN